MVTNKSISIKDFEKEYRTAKRLKMHRHYVAKDHSNKLYTWQDIKDILDKDQVMPAEVLLMVKNNIRLLQSERKKKELKDF